MSFTRHLARPLAWAAFTASFLFLLSVTVLAQTTLLNVSYDVARELYKDINPAFIADWKAKTGKDVDVNQSHGGSSAQARAVADGLDADVVTMNQRPTSNSWPSGAVVAADWRKRFPHNATPYTTTMVFLVRKGNPKGIKDWDDLVKPGVQVIVPNPKTWRQRPLHLPGGLGLALQKGGTEAAGAGIRDQAVQERAGARRRRPRRHHHLPAAQHRRRAGHLRERGDRRRRASSAPTRSTSSIPRSASMAENPVAVVETVVAKKGTRKVAKAYLEFLYSPQGQEIVAKHAFRPRSRGGLAVRMPAAFRP